MKDKAIQCKDTISHILYINDHGYRCEGTGKIEDYGDLDIKFRFDDELFRYIDYEKIIDIQKLPC